MGGVASHGLGRRGQERLASQGGEVAMERAVGGSLLYRRKLKTCLSVDKHIALRRCRYCSFIDCSYVAVGLGLSCTVWWSEV